MNESFSRATADRLDAAAPGRRSTLLGFAEQRGAVIAATLVLMILGTATLLLPVPLWLGALAGLAITAVAPGILLATIFLADRLLSWLELGVLAIGLGYVCLQLIVLAIQAFPGPLLSNHVAAAFWVVYLVLAIVSVRIRPDGAARSARAWLPNPGNRPGGSRGRAAVWALLVVVLVAALFRFTYLGYSEFQGDEARAVLLAAGVLDGHDDALLVHKKGPGEVLLPATPYALLRRINELSARISFALASLAALLTVYALGERGFRAGAGLIAAALLAADGFEVGFARIVQYQSLVLLATALGVLCYLRFYQRRHPPNSDGSRDTPTPNFHRLDWAYLVTGAAVAGVGMLGHYEAVFALPAMAVLFITRAWQERWPLTAWVRRALAPAFILVGLVGVFYVPFVRHPHFGRTFSYIAEERVGGGFAYNNIADFFHRTTFYNSTYYIVFLALVGVGVVTHRMWIALPDRDGSGVWKSGAVALFLGGLVAVLVAPALFVIGGPSTLADLAFLVFLIPVAIVILSPNTDAVFRANLTWMAVPFFAVMFFIKDPGTHSYTMFPAWALLAGLGIVETFHWVQPRLASRLGTGFQARTVRWLPAGLLAGLFLVFAYHTWFVMVSHSPEYKRVYPNARNPLYWTAWEELPDGGFFGFPYRAGWKAVGELFHAGILDGDYDSNEEHLITGWYTRGAVRCTLDPEYYIVAKNVQDRVKIPLGKIESEYYLIETIEINGEEKLWVYQRSEPNAPAAIRTLAAHAKMFDRQASGPAFNFGPPLGEALIQNPVGAGLGDRVELIGYDLAARTVEAGGEVGLVLYWRTLAPMETNYTVFTHIETDQIWGQQDNIPVCGKRPTVAWERGEILIDPYSIQVREDAPPGQYPLLVGMYDVATGQRLPVTDSDQADALGPSEGNADYAAIGGNSLQLATITVEEAPAPGSSP